MADGTAAEVAAQPTAEQQAEAAAPATDGALAIAQPAAHPSAEQPSAEQQAEAMRIYQQAMEQYMAMAAAQAQAQAMAQAQAQGPAAAQAAALAAQQQQYHAMLAAQQSQAQATQQMQLQQSQAQAAQQMQMQQAAQLAAQRAQQPAQHSNLAFATVQQAAPSEDGKGKGKGKGVVTQLVDAPDLVTGLITKVDDSGDFGFVKLKQHDSHVFLHKQHYTSSRHDQGLEVGVMIQCKLFAKEGGKHSCSAAYEVSDPEETHKLKQELGCEILDGTVYTGWIVYHDQPKQLAKVRSKMLEDMHPNIKQDVKRGASMSKQRTVGLSTRMCVQFQLELNDKDQLLARNVFVVPGANPIECPFPIDDGDGVPRHLDGSKGKGKDGKGKGKEKGKGKSKKGFEGFEGFLGFEAPGGQTGPMGGFGEPSGEVGAGGGRVGGGTGGGGGQGKAGEGGKGEGAKAGGGPVSKKRKAEEEATKKVVQMESALMEGSWGAPAPVAPKKVTHAISDPAEKMRKLQSFMRRRSFVVENEEILIDPRFEGAKEETQKNENGEDGNTWEQSDAHGDQSWNSDQYGNGNQDESWNSKGDQSWQMNSGKGDQSLQMNSGKGHESWQMDSGKGFQQAGNPTWNALDEGSWGSAASASPKSAAPARSFMPRRSEPFTTNQIDSDEEEEEGGIWNGKGGGGTWAMKGGGGGGGPSGGAWDRKGGGGMWADKGGGGGIWDGKAGGGGPWADQGGGIWNGKGGGSTWAPKLGPKGGGGIWDGKGGGGGGRGGGGAWADNSGGGSWDGQGVGGGGGGTWDGKAGGDTWADEGGTGTWDGNGEGAAWGDDKSSGYSWDSNQSWQDDSWTW